MDCWDTCIADAIANGHLHAEFVPRIKIPSHFRQPCLFVIKLSLSDELFTSDPLVMFLEKPCHSHILAPQLPMARLL